MYCLDLLWTNFSLIDSVFILHDLLIIYYFVFQLVQGAFFYTLISIFAALVFSDYSKVAFDKVKRLIRQNRGAENFPFPYRYLGTIEQSLKQHHLVCYLSLAGNHQVFGRITLWFLITNMPLNIHCIAQLVLTKNGIYETIIFSLIIFYQLMSSVVVFQPSAWCSVQLHQPSKMMPRMIGQMSGRKWMLYKLKVDDLFFRLTWGSRVAAQIGPISQMTYQATLEVPFVVLFTFFCIKR